MRKINCPRGFTIIELLVVIAIISLLSSIVLSFLTNARRKAQYARAKVEINQIIKAITYAESEKDDVLMRVTNCVCSECDCKNYSVTNGSLKNISSGSACYTRMYDAINKIKIATGGVYGGLTNIMRDPWGSPYLIDENEEEYPATPCRSDYIRTVGADGIIATADDLGFNIPFVGDICRSQN